MKNINLLPGLSKQEFFKKKAYKKIITVILTSFTVCVLLSVITTFLRIKTTDEYNLLLEKKSALKNELTSFLTPEAQAASIKNKIASILKIQESQANFENFLARLSPLIPSGVTIDNFSLDKAGNLSFQVKSPSSNELELFSKLLESEENGGKFLKNIIMTNISEIGNKSYRFNVNAQALEL